VDAKETAKADGNDHSTQGSHDKSPKVVEKGMTGEAVASGDKTISIKKE
jgi:hypothetical protein